MIKKIYLDMDGVLSDFDSMLKMHWPEHVPHSNHLPKKEFWAKVHSIPYFWIDMPMMPNAVDLYEHCWDMVGNNNVQILTAPAKSDPRCKPQKIDWISYNIDPGAQVIFSDANEKWHFAAPGHVLIDDKQPNIDDWIRAGGIGILYKDYETTIRELEQYSRK